MINEQTVNEPTVNSGRDTKSPEMWIPARSQSTTWIGAREESDGICICSGGLDSITTAYHLMRLGYRPHLLSFDYGQRHAKELNYALWMAEREGLHWTLVDLRTVTELIDSSALTFGQDVPEGHYAADNMALTVVPNRNMIMLSIAIAAAVNFKYEYVAAGMHAGDRAQYPDCRPEFIHSMILSAQWGNEGNLHPQFQLMTPFLHLSKDDIAFEAWRCGVLPHWTWSCYKGGEKHCGRCGTCVERLEAINTVVESGKAPPTWDQTEYEDKEYWKLALLEHQASK